MATTTPAAPETERARYRVRFPPPGQSLDQDEAYFYVIEDGEPTHLRFHDYDEIYERPGLYEQLFYERLKCRSPAKVVDTFRHTLDQNGETLAERRVLDLGAGNGMVGAEFMRHGVSRLVGVDIIPEACAAALRDRPGIYDRYYVRDFCALDAREREELLSWSFDCLVTVAALGYGDIPPRAFHEALHLVDDEGWVVFNIKETFLDRTDCTGFSRMIRELVFSEYLDLHHLERYRHRLSIDGKPLYYYAIVARKTGMPFPSSVELD